MDGRSSAQEALNRLLAATYATDLPRRLPSCTDTSMGNPIDPDRHGNPHIASPRLDEEGIAKVMFRATFADDEDEALVERKWHEWGESRRLLGRQARAVIAYIQSAD